MLTCTWIFPLLALCCVQAGAAGSPVLMQENLEDAVLVAVEVTLPEQSWLAVGLSPLGGMVGSRAVIGGLEGASNNTKEYDLNRKLPNFVNEVDEFDRVGRNASFRVEEVIDDGDAGQFYVHHLTVTFPTWIELPGSGIGICGMNLIWAHANQGVPWSKQRLGYHGNSRGISGTVEC